jgi:hypothetical protein
MSLPLTPTELGNFAFDVLERPGPNEWFAPVVPENEVEQVCGALREELSAIGDVEPLHTHLRGADRLIEFVRAHPTEVLLLSGLESFEPLDWQKLDGARSLLQREGASVLVLGEEALGHLLGHAPNLASWLGGSAWRLEQQPPSLSAREREERLASLREWSSMTDAEVIARAEQGTLLPPTRSGSYCWDEETCLANDELHSAQTHLLKTMRSLQARLEQLHIPLPSRAEELHEELRRVLLRAIRAEVLLNPPYDTTRLLKLDTPEKSRKVKQLGGTHAILGGY